MQKHRKITIEYQIVNSIKKSWLMDDEYYTFYWEIVSNSIILHLF